MSLNLRWKAIYEDGTEFNQFDELGNERRYQDIDREKLVRFDLEDSFTGKAVYSLYLSDGQRLIYRRRTFIKMGGGVEKSRFLIWLVGYQHTVMTNSGPRNFIVINYIHEDGSISLDGARDNLELLAEER